MLEMISQIGALFYPLLALSLLGLTFIIERCVFFIRLPKIQESDSFQALTKELQDNAKTTKTLRDELLSFRLAALQSKLMYGIHVLRIVAVLSPMLGLLGTVLGMIRAFKGIAGQTGPVLPSMIADGLWNAMLTTAFGLSIALPCLFAAFIYARIAEKRLEQYQQHLNRQSLKIDGVQIQENS